MSKIINLINDKGRTWRLIPSSVFVSICHTQLQVLLIVKLFKNEMLVQFYSPQLILNNYYMRVDLGNWSLFELGIVNSIFSPCKLSLDGQHKAEEQTQVRTLGQIYFSSKS